MRATMRMEVDTPWANRMEVSVFAELENDPGADLVAGEVVRRMIDTMALMTNELRAFSERVKSEREEEEQHGGSSGGNTST